MFLCLCLGMVGKKAVVSSEEEAVDAVVQESGITEETLAPDVQPPAVEKKELPERPRFIELPEIFKELERAPVKFNHDKHARSAGKGWLHPCHPRTKMKSSSLPFPRNGTRRDKDALMNSYHDACIGCHQEQADAGEKAGPVTCGECHRRSARSI